MPRIAFTRNYEVKDGSGTRYTKGQTLDCSEASANHFINRRAAVLASEVKAKANTDEKPETADADEKSKGKVKK